MKQTVFGITMLMLVYTAQAQTEKGRKMVGGNLGFSFNGSDRLDTNRSFSNKNNQRSFNLNVYGGKFVKDRVMIGLSIGYGFNKDITTSIDNRPSVPYYSKSEQKYFSETYSATVFTRYYTKRLIDRVSFYANIGLGYSWSYSWQGSVNIQNGFNLNYSNSFTNKTVSNTVHLNVIPGLAFFLNKNLALETALGGFGFNTGNNANYNNGVKVNSTVNGNLNTNVNINFSGLRFGMNYYF